MTEESQRVVVIQCASRDVCISAIKWAMRALSLEPGDELTFLASFCLFNSPSMFALNVAGKFLGLFETDKKIDEERIAKKKEEYHKSAALKKISEQCEAEKILFRIEVLGGPFPEAAVNAAASFKPTLVILDRQMKKYTTHFMERLSCAFLTKKRDDTIEHLRGPRVKEPSRTGNAGFCGTGSRLSSSKELMANKIMGPRKISTSISSLRKARCPLIHSQGRENHTTSSEEDMARGYCLLPSPSTLETGHTALCPMGTPVEKPKQHSSNHEAYETVEMHKNSVCSVCNNTRPKIGLQRDFKYAELHAATQGFSDKNFLSEGGFGSVYKGELHGLKIAVKQHKGASLQGEKEFKCEVEVLSKARHENVVMLLGSCSEGNNGLLVYEYVCNGSLDQHLSQHSRKPLTWKDRMKVAMGAAKGLLYLHENNIIHRDMRPNNILVTHDYHTLLGDFGLARTQNAESIYSTDFAGTLGYLAPEYAESGKVSSKTDVYSFGVILLELITGRRTIDKRLGENSLVGWARPLLKERNYPDLIDERMQDTHDCHQLFWMIRLAEKCLSRDPKKRLSMNTVVSALSHIMQGNTCSIVLKGCFPSHSDSSMSDSPKSERSLQGSSEAEGEEDESSYSGPLLLSSTSQQSLRFPPSPQMALTDPSLSPSIFDGMPSIFNGLTNEEKRRISEEKSGLSYIT
ncbi:hypothetical protein L6164_017759 [Bauhinia variegata]|uniref:Uncharacterized protein n=1 Tax=Bauhinia variegata TaxID=167791 RepID=A0ACB9NDV3_BAUVA|nr:hypothetical protein L6164_017759 [Bauhinia variegata]